MSIKRIKCPKCQGTSEVELLPELESVECQHCHMTLRIQRPTVALPPPEVEEEPEAAKPEARKPKKKKRKAKPPPSGFLAKLSALPKPALIGGGVFAMLMFVGLGWVLFGRGERAAVGDGNRASATKPTAEVAAQIEADLAALQSGQPTVPLDWTVPPLGPSILARVPDRLDLPGFTVISDAKRAYGIASEEKDSIGIQPIDLATGKLTGQPRTFIKGFEYPDKPEYKLAPDGTIAFTDKGRGAPSAKYRLFDPSAETPRELNIPVVRERAIVWSAGSKLWVHQYQFLALVDAKTGNTLFKTAEAPKKPLPTMWGEWAMAPNGTALIVADPRGRFLVLDAETGKTLADFGLEGSRNWSALRISPNGSRLVATVEGGNPNSRDPEATSHFWNLRTGAYEGKYNCYGGNGPIEWFGDRIALYGIHAIDVESRSLLGLVRAKYQSNKFENRRPYRLTDDGRWWARRDPESTQWGAIPWPAERRKPIFEPGATLQVEAQLGDPALDQRAVALLSAVAEKAGFKLGSGSWTLRIVGKLADAEQSMVFPGSGKEIPVPRVAADIDLVAPDGTVVTQVPARVSFRDFRSKYYTGLGNSNPWQYVDKFNFPGDPATLMAAETKDQFIRTLPFVRWPHVVYQGVDPTKTPHFIDLDYLVAK